MADIYKLYNQIKHYEWGSPDSIPRFLGIENSAKTPWAEMWMGTHPGAPSQVQAAPLASPQVTPLVTPPAAPLVGREMISLCELSGGQLPFLFKLLAAGKPLSIQAHPGLDQAREGFLRENKAGIAIDAPERNYKDSNHKPEILCALVPFTVMAGFRKPVDITRSLEALLKAAPFLQEALAPLARALDSGSLKDFFRFLFELSKPNREQLCFFLESAKDPNGDSAITQEQWHLMRAFAAQYPGDPAVLSPLYLNLFTLEAGQAIFIPAGILHAYISGFGVELMACSDNVLRGGLTPKHIDIPELMNILEFTPFMPEIITAPVSSSYFRYPAPCGEFSLFFMCCEEGAKVFPVNGPAVCIVTGGELRSGGAVFKKGESFFVPQAGGGSLSFEGSYSLFAASSGE
jgi:mannose-6-phosphate isomerase